MANDRIHPLLGNVRHCYEDFRQAMSEMSREELELALYSQSVACSLHSLEGYPQAFVPVPNEEINAAMVAANHKIANRYSELQQRRA